MAVKETEMQNLIMRLNETNGWNAELEDDGHILVESSDGNFIVNIICWHKNPLVRASLTCCFDKWGNAFYENICYSYEEVFESITSEEFKSEVASEIIYTLLEQDKFDKSNKWLEKLIKLYEEYEDE